MHIAKTDVAPSWRNLVCIASVQIFNRSVLNYHWPSCWVILVGLSLNLIESATLSAQTPTKIWTDGQADNNWFTANNWAPTGLPGNTDIVAVNNGTTAQIGASGAVAGSLFIGNSLPGSPAAAGSTVQLLSAGSLGSNSAPVNNIVIGPDGKLTLSGGSIIVSTIQDNGNILFDSAAAYTIATPVSGSGNIMITGSGTVKVTGGINTYSGITTISAGELQAGAANVFS